MATNHSHHEGHSHTNNRKALKLSFILIAGYMFVEFIGGFLTNSLALISDAGHMLSDAAALGLSLAAIILGQKAASSEKTYGYKRFEILAALLNGIALAVLSIYIFIEAIHRLTSPPEVIGQGMIIISTIGLIVNIIVAWILSRGDNKHNLNLKSAFMHVIGDLLGSVGAIIAAILILSFGWYIADPIASMVVSVLIIFSAWNILKEAVNILMEGKPSDIDIDELRNSLISIQGVIDAHDLHIWMITNEFRSITAHLTVSENIDRDMVLKEAMEKIVEQTEITHITIQVEGPNFKISEDNHIYNFHKTEN